MWGTFNLHVFIDSADNKEHLLLAMGEVDTLQPILTRIHSECLTGDALFSLRCDCGPQLQEAMRAISLEGTGAILYLRQEGRGIGLANKIRAYALQDQGLDTVEANKELGFDADERNYSICQHMLNHVGITSINLLTNNPEKVKALTESGIKVASRVALHVGKNSHNQDYLAVKKDKMQHIE
jgi:GTP cyclohydrolase II